MVADCAGISTSCLGSGQRFSHTKHADCLYINSELDGVIVIHDKAVHQYILKSYLTCILNTCINPGFISYHIYTKCIKDVVNIQAYMYKEIKSAPHTLYDISCLIAKTSSKKIIHELHELVLLPFTS